MKLGTLISLLALISVIAVAGCVGSTEDSNYSFETGEDEELEPIYEQKSEPKPEPKSEPKTGCVVDADCNDADRCTTDSCVAGSCIYDVESGCLQKTTGEPYISSVTFTGDELIVVNANNWDVSEWTIQNANGDVYYTFPERFTLNNYVNLKEGNDISTTVNKYTGQTDFWADNGDKTFLIDNNGNVKSELAG